MGGKPRFLNVSEVLNKQETRVPFRRRRISSITDDVTVAANTCGAG